MKQEGLQVSQDVPRLDALVDPLWCKVSVIVPVYNSERYLREALNSILAQTHANLELICVDDGSSDASPQILAEYAEADPRVVVIRQENAGPGVARNAGIDKATGKYLYFLDSDDFAEPTLLAECVSALERTGADLAAFTYNEFRMDIDSTGLSPWACFLDDFPGDAVSWRDNPNKLFRAFQNLPWTKVFRTSFINDNNIRFQDIYLTEDLMFAAPALALAKSIAIVRKPLVTQRIGTQENTMANKSAHPLDFITAFEALKKFLQEQGLYESLRIAYIDWAADSCFYNLRSMNTYEGYIKVYETLKERAFASLGLEDAAPEDFEDVFFHECLSKQFINDVMALDVNDYLFKTYCEARDGCDVRELHIQNLVRDWTAAKDACEALRPQLDAERAEAKRLQGEADAASFELKRVKDSTAWKVGRAATLLPRTIKSRLG